MCVAIQGQSVQPSLRNIAQFGGTYHQVLDCENYMLAARTGGVEVLLPSSGQWKSVSHLPLSSIPVLYKSEEGIFARFKSRLLKLGLDDKHQLRVVSDHTLSANYPGVPNLLRSISKNGVSFTISDANKGLMVQQRDGTYSTCAFPGYSYPSSLTLSRDEHEILVADVGAIHAVNIATSPPTLSSRLYLPGWPKDIASDSIGVYCANVLGVRWYRETNIYPFLEEIDRLSHIHFRMAKVIAHEGRIVACDEVRGIHFFAAQNGRLQARGGLMLDGGAWDCEVYRDHLLVATGDEGWITAPFDWTTLTAGQPIRHLGAGRVHSVVSWPAAKRIVVLSNKGIKMYPMSYSSGMENCLEDFPGISAWSAIPIGSYLLVAAAKQGLLVLKCDILSPPEICSQFNTVEARDICFDGAFVWLADGKGGIRCYTFDSDTGVLDFAGVFPVAGFSRGVLSTASRLYVGAGDGGLAVLDLGRRG